MSLKPAAEWTLTIGGVIKHLIYFAAAVFTIGTGIWNLMTGQWIVGLVIVFLGTPVVLWVVDIMTGIVLALFVGISEMIARLLARVRPQPNL
jgi:hypothetical protein